MFQDFFEFHKINYQNQVQESASFIKHSYAFYGKEVNGKRKRYIVAVEQYSYNTYAVKFHLFEHRRYKHKYSILSHQFECSRVLTTVGRIMIEVLKENPFASFAFIGSPLPKEKPNNTKRFRVYSKVMRQVISTTQMEHYLSPNSSCYIILNRHNEEPDLLNKVITMFRSMYNLEISLEGIETI